jgi:hypothetical protein
MKKLIPILLSLVLILALFPAGKACADYQNGQACPKGCGGTLVVEKNSSNSGEHSYHCTKCSFSGTEKHWGGKVTCDQGPVCKGCGKVYGDPEHDYQPWEGHETITRMYFKCTRCGAIYWEHNSETWNMKWDFVRYTNGEHIKYYKAHSTGPDYDGVLTVIPVFQNESERTAELGLYMSPDDVYVWTWENENTIEFVRDDATLTFDVREITPEMFGLTEEQAPDFYVFSLTPAGEDGWSVKAEAMTGEERTPAQELKGFTLTVAGKEMEITENGVYKPE